MVKTVSKWDNNTYICSRAAICAIVIWQIIKMKNKLHLVNLLSFQVLGSISHMLIYFLLTEAFTFWCEAKNKTFPKEKNEMKNQMYSIVRPQVSVCLAVSVWFSCFAVCS